MSATDIDKLAIYTRSDDLGLLTLVSPTTQIGAGSTTPAGVVAFGFDFYFDGTGYVDTAALGVDGYVRLDGAGGIFGVNTEVTIAPWADSLKTATGTGYVKTETQGTAPFRRFIVEWLVYSYSGDDAVNNDLLQFQCVLYETSGRIEHRYAARVRTGTPTATTTAARVLKGNTFGTADNYRDLAIDNLTLGASKTTTTATLGSADYDALVAGGVVVAEPNWPMCGRAHMIDPEAVTGLNVYDDVLWKIANFVNWYWCAHTPALVNFAPWQQTGAASVDYVVPCVPSAEGLTYAVYVQAYASAGTTCTTTVYEDAAADPQPTTGGDWSAIGSGAQAVTGSAWNVLTVIAATIDPATTYLRINVAVSAGTVIVGSVLIVPSALLDVDETYTSLTGFVPMSIRALRVQGAGVYAEWFNRAWANLAYIANDRRQAVWSSVWPSTESIANTTERPTRTIGVSKAAIPGFRGQAAKARIYARDNVADATLQLAEAGNGLLAEWTVGTHAGEFRAQTADITLVSDEPVITATVDPGGTTYPMAVLVDWAPAWSTGDLFLGVTPAPRLSLLLALVRRMERALRVYAYCGNATMLARGKTSSNKWHLQTWVGPAVKALRPKIARDSDDQNATSQESLIYANSSGSGANDEITVPSPHTRGRDDYPPEGTIAIGAGGELYDAAPAASVARLLESPTATSMTGGARERVEVLRGVGITFVPVKADPLTL